MRRWFFVFLMFLLPLRGWVGDAMAMQMALPGHHAPTSGSMQLADVDAEPAHLHLSTMAVAAADDCGGHAGSLDTDDAMVTTHCEVCAMCQTCHTVAVLLFPELMATLQVNPTSPPATMQVFASADRALLLKPPIS